MTATKRILMVASAALLSASLVGCAAEFGKRAENGITFYCPGAGNVDLGDAGLREGLEARGYKGEVSRLTWTISFNPAIDQAVRVNARVGASRLAEYIQDYQKRFPGREVNLVGLSAGSGIVIWALEDLPEGAEVDNVVLLSSSLSSDYDVSKALKHVRGKIYCYYSPHDMVLAGPMKVFGTIDGRLGVEGAGSIGLHPPRGKARVVNIRWQREFAKYGYNGGHMDSTAPRFVQHYVADHLVDGTAAGQTVQVASTGTAP